MTDTQDDCSGMLAGTGAFFIALQCALWVRDLWRDGGVAVQIMLCCLGALALVWGIELVLFALSYTKFAHEELPAIDEEQGPLPQ